jgi:hypothetical protein
LIPALGSIICADRHKQFLIVADSVMALAGARKLEEQAIEAEEPSAQVNRAWAAGRSLRVAVRMAYPALQLLRLTLLAEVC